MSAMTTPTPNGMTAQAMSESTKVRIGASTKTTRLAPLGITVSFRKSFRPSAIGCNRPKGPTTLGPMRSCAAASTLRSA